jgi:hypothetical protein
MYTGQFLFSRNMNIVLIRHCHQLLYLAINSTLIYETVYLLSYLGTVGSRDSGVGIVTVYGLDDEIFGVRFQVGSRIFFSSSRPDRFWGPSNLLSNGYQRPFPRGGKAAGVWNWPLTSD